MKDAAASLFVKQKLSKMTPKAGAKWNEAVLAELRLTNHEQLTFKINFFMTKSGNLANPQPQRVHHGKHQVVGWPAVGSLRPVWQPGGDVQKSPGLVRVDPKRWLLSRRAPGSKPHR